jgi:hypothetical protein
MHVKQLQDPYKNKTIPSKGGAGQISWSTTKAATLTGTEEFNAHASSST